MTLQMFYDYACPYSFRGYKNLLELLPNHPDITVEWHPCEAHPRPEVYGRHSDLLARGMYVVRDLGGDVMHYHKIAYRAAHVDCADIEDVETVSQLVGEICDSTAFADALNNGNHTAKLDENNRLVWDEYDCPAVPSFRLNGKMLMPIPKVGIKKALLGEFLKG